MLSVKELICEDCEEKLVDTGISRLYDMVWVQDEKTKQFRFTHSEVSDRKEEDFICNQCGSAICDSIIDELDVEDLSIEGASKGCEENASESKGLSCSHCDRLYSDVGVYQLWDVDWRWNEDANRFEVHDAYASELDEYDICCNSCGHSVEEDLVLEELQLVEA